MSFRHVLYIVSTRDSRAKPDSILATDTERDELIQAELEPITPSFKGWPSSQARHSTMWDMPVINRTNRPSPFGPREAMSSPHVVVASELHIKTTKRTGWLRSFLGDRDTTHEVYSHTFKAREPGRPSPTCDTLVMQKECAGRKSTFLSMCVHTTIMMISASSASLGALEPSRF
nr:hypothetical protein CFP56_57815 [Quercus suber]